MSHAIANIGIVGHAADKFTDRTMRQARELIYDLLVLRPEACVVSGRCPLGGVDVWAEEIAATLGLPTLIHPPRVPSWEKGYKPRNLKIARDADELHVIVVSEYPVDYHGLRFQVCYHCGTRRPWHVKSGGCWTAIQASRLGKKAHWHILPP